MAIKFQIIVKRGNETLHAIIGERDVKNSEITFNELQRIPEVEHLLERLTGFRYHIQEQC